MKTKIRLLPFSFASSLLLVSFGCALESEGENGSDGGSGAMATGGNASGGSLSGSGGVLGSGGALSSGGAPGSGGLAAAGGGSTGGAGFDASGGAYGTGGESAGTGGESAGTGGEAPMGLAPDPSAGCGNTNPQTGSSGSPLNDGKPYYVKLPAGYDPNTPYRLIFVFNPTGNPITWGENGAGYEQVASDAIRVYPHENPQDLSRSPGGWSGDDVAAFEPLYNAVMSNFCVDQARVFAVGESSGGDYASVLGCEYGDKLRGVGPCATKPVGGYPLNAGQRNCVGDVTAIVMHGLNDSVVGAANGPATRDFYTDVNDCGEGSEPVMGYTDPMSNCVMYTGCKEDFPVYWCQHQDPNYSGTQHGWPGFAAKMTWEIFSAY